MAIRTYRDLLVWQKSMRLVTDTYRISQQFPKEEVYGLCAQVRRCAVSIPSNIAEGYARYAHRDYLRFLRMAMGSLFELQTQLEIAENLEYIDGANTEPLQEASSEIERMLSAMMRKVAPREEGRRTTAYRREGAEG